MPYPATSLGNTFVGGNYVLTATGRPVSQAAGTSVQVRGDLTVTGASIVLGGAGNLIGGTTSLPATNTVVLRQSGAIELFGRNDAGVTFYSGSNDAGVAASLMAAAGVKTSAVDAAEKLINEDIWNRTLNGLDARLV